MGVSTNIITVWGVRLPWTEEIGAFVEGPIEDHYDDPDAPYILVESMAGEWIMPGVKLFDGGDFRWGLEGGTGDVAIDIGDLPRQEAEYKAAFIRTYPGHAHLMDAPFRLWCLTFYS